MKQSMLAEASNDRSPEETLWRAVIEQQLRDGVCTLKDGASIRYRNEARAWFNSSNPSFRYVCDLAGFKPVQLANKAQALFAEADKAPAKPARPRTPRDPSTYKSKRYSYNGQCLTLREWSAQTGITVAALQSRLQLKWPIERMLTQPMHSHRPGVGQDFREQAGTGGGSDAQDCTELEFL